MLLIWIWIALMSAVTFAATALDKFRARSGRWRIPEVRLLGLALIGGSPGLLLAMLLFRHKTAKASFRLAAGGIALIHLSLLIGYWVR